MRKKSLVGWMDEDWYLEKSVVGFVDHDNISVKKERRKDKKVRITIEEIK